MNEMNREMRRMSEREERLGKKPIEILVNTTLKKFQDLKEFLIIWVKLGQN